VSPRLHPTRSRAWAPCTTTKPLTAARPRAAPVPRVTIRQRPFALGDAVKACASGW